jgi:hypothetical protein
VAGPPGPPGPEGESAGAEEGSDWASDLLHVFQSLDARVAQLEERFERQESEGQRMSASGQAVADELRAQRLALVRLQRSLGGRVTTAAPRWRRPGEE